VSPGDVDSPAGPPPAGLAEHTHFLERWGWAGAFALLTLGFVLRVRGLSTYWLNPDEGIYYSALTRTSFGDFWADVIANAHPPAFYLLLRGLGLFTWDFVWLRGTSVLFGTAAIWIFWLVGRELGGKGTAGVGAGLITAALVAVNGEAIALSQLLRPYMMLLALLGLALFHLLRYRAEPTDRNLIAYAMYSCLALLTHYSAVMAFAVFLGVTVYFGLARVVDNEAWSKLAKLQAIPAVLIVLLYQRHLGTSLGSDVMSEALAPGGWLGGWLVASPGDAWRGFLNFQVFHLPPSLRGRSAVLMLAAIAVSLSAKERTVSVLAVTAVSGALLAASLGLYPIGESRHNTWLVVFTLPALGSLAGRAIKRGHRTTWVLIGALTVVLLFGGPSERVLGARPLVTNELGEQVIRRQDLASLVVERLGPEGAPRTILMSEQTYNLLMPLYPSAREDVRMSDDAALLTFSYGAREIVVARRWDWEGLRDVERVLRAIPSTFPGVFQDGPSTVLVMAGGWGSSLFLDLGELEERGALLDWAGVPGVGPAGENVQTLGAFVVDRQALLRSSITPDGLR